MSMAVNFLPKKRMLFCIHAFYPDADANTNASKAVIETVVEEFDVVFLCRTNQQKEVETSYKGSRVIHVAADSKIRNRLVHWKRIVLSNQNGLFRNVAFGVMKLIAWATGVESNLTRKFHKLLSDNEFDIVLTVSSPFLMHEPAIKAKKKNMPFQWIAIIEDPYATYIGHQDIHGLMAKQEEKLFRYADRILMPPELYAENIDGPYSQHMHKARMLHFGNLYPNSRPSRYRKGQRIISVYSGSLQDIAVRNPESMFQIVSKCHAMIEICLLVSSWCHETTELANEFLSDEIKQCIRTNVSLEDAIRSMEIADILINIGNEAVNQLPSKLLDYLSLGKPIVNFYSHAADTSMKLLKSYPLALNLSTKDMSVDQCVELFNEFCFSSCGKRVEDEMLIQLFPQYLPKRISKTFLEAVRSLENYHHANE